MYAVIMAGGKGTRFWPRSRQKRPKQLLNIVGRRSMLQQTVGRISSLLPLQNILVVAGEDHGQEVRDQLTDLLKENIILEPVGRNTAACIGLAALLVHHRDPEAVMVVLPADHLITEENLFLGALRAAVAMARRQEALITLGIRPTAPKTGYGYVEAGEGVGTAQDHVFYQVTSFHEKPDQERAEQYLKMGNFYWNSGMFVWQAKVILEGIQRYLPTLYADLQKLNGFDDYYQLNTEIARIYPDLESVSIDYGVMEKANNVLMLPADFGWNDLGTWASMVEIWPKDDQHNIHQGELIALDSRRNVVYSERRLCVLLGVEDLIVVDTEDALLVCPVGRAQDVGQILDKMKQRGMEQYL
ncbi:MAG: mannose-1-phosphate guanylyltransferase [Deltaproteobacteria bacterium]|nr:MAG: mannose-1-phosphate guanylyltransferase [Deltaproteobacteria bacterium]